MTEKVRRRALTTDVHANLYEGPEPGTVLYFFKDEITLRNKPFTIPGKGVLSNRVSSFIHDGLAGLGLPTAYLNMVNMREQLLLETSTLPFDVVVRNIISDDRAKSFGLDGGTALPAPMVEYEVNNSSPRRKADERTYLGAEVVAGLGWANEDELAHIKKISLRVNDYMTGLFHGASIQLVDFSMRFGRLAKDYYEDPTLVIISQFTPETCSFMDWQNEMTLPLASFYQKERRKVLKNQRLILPYEIMAKRFGLFHNTTKL